MHSKDIRDLFLKFFENREHTRVPSAPVIPDQDESLLFINAGMNQFKDVFTGKSERRHSRAVSTQKCIRVSGKHNDLEEVGKDGTHHTFFEMLGNWSFGDYFKKKAIEFAWELMTGKYDLPGERFYATVLDGDDEAEKIWREHIGLPEDRVLRFGKKDNFWQMGETGPCGPCTELHFDRGEKYDSDNIETGVNKSGQRYVELWNLVFMELYLTENGDLEELPKKHIDTGLGLERLVAVLQDKESNYETDLFMPIIEKIENISGYSFDNPERKTPFRVISDHVRMLTFAIADGVLPSNDGRGYVLRRVARRASRYCRELDVHEPMIYKLVSPVIDMMGSVYPAITDRVEHITRVIKAEEERFNETLDKGLEKFKEIADEAVEDESRTIWGEDAFKLYDTYGFPIDLTRLLAEERGLVVDMKGFQAALEEQRERGRQASKFEDDHKLGTDEDWNVVSEGEDSIFLGYENSSLMTEIRSWKPEDDDKVSVILHKTPFYAESGGQVADQGKIVGENMTLKVVDVQKGIDETYIHKCVLEEGEIYDETVEAKVDLDRRENIKKNHTATHLLQAALREILGDHVHQSGSLVAPDRLRFDYTHYATPDKEELLEVEVRVNEFIQNNFDVSASISDYKEALDKGAIALFGEQYDEEVRVISIGDVSRELCGGTHVESAGCIGYFKIVSESGISSGTRRIVALTGEKAVREAYKDKKYIDKISSLFKVKPEEVLCRINDLRDENKELQQKINNLQHELASKKVESIIEEAPQIGESYLIVEKVDANSNDELLSFGDSIKEKIDSGIAVLSSVLAEDKVVMVGIVTEDIVSKSGISADELVKSIAGRVGGGGGGRDTFAQAGGSQPENLDEALEFARKHISHEIAK